MNNAAVLQALQSAVNKHRNGQVNEAEAEYKSLLGTDPQNAEAMRLYAMLLLHLSRTPEAIDLLERAVSLRKNAPILQGALGEALRVGGRVDEAIAAFERAISLNASDPEVLTNFGKLYLQIGQTEDALTYIKKAIALRDSYWQAHVVMGETLLRRQTFTAAANHFRKAYENIPLNPSMNGARAGALAGMGAAASGAGNVQMAQGAFAQAVQMAPDDARLHLQLGALLRSLGQHAEAEKHLRRAIEIDPNLTDAHRLLAGLVGQRGDPSAGVEHFEKAIEKNRDDYSSHSALLMSMLYVDDLTPQQVFAAHAEWGQRHAAKFDPGKLKIDNPDPDRRLRVGYVSPNMRMHAVASFLLPLLENHNREKFEIVAYSVTDTPDEITQRIRSLVAEFHDVRLLTDQKLAERVRNDRIDILIDLAGHTEQFRLMTFARRPAPVQMTYLGYPGTTGVAAIDYRLTDAISDPPGSESLHAEKLLRIDKCFLCYSPLETNIEVAPAPKATNGFVSFGSFNNTTKITPTTARLWASVLAAVPNSRLVIKSNKLIDPANRQMLSDLLTQFDIPVERLALLGPQPSFFLHLADYRHVDVALDTFPYNGTTTTCEALWMGVPVVTLAGQHHAARVSASLLTALGKPEWIANNTAEFAAVAARVAANSPDRAGLRQTMRDSRLMNAPAHAHAVESCLRQAWRNACAAARA